MLKFFERLIAAGDTDWKSLKNKKKKTIFYCCRKAITNTPDMAEVTDWNHIIRQTSSLSPLSNFFQKQKMITQLQIFSIKHEWIKKVGDYILSCIQLKQKMITQLQMLSIKHEWKKKLEVIYCVSKNVLFSICLAHSKV